MKERECKSYLKLSKLKLSRRMVILRGTKARRLKINLRIIELLAPRRLSLMVNPNPSKTKEGH